jgi:N-acetylneuraminate synthase
MNFENIFKNLFVLELANNHLENLQRGIKIINDHAKIVRYNNVKISLKT